VCGAGGLVFLFDGRDADCGDFVDLGEFDLNFSRRAIIAFSTQRLIGERWF